ncbi:hypothetical protein lbkm_3653 [Lachnospiraceae bacterium KM106-2]|nr:hypothetical protein lbkm_3653 [Lachnospiraceae bacterium KM106-2]
MKRIAYLLLLVIMCYFLFGLLMHTDGDCRVVGSVEDHMYRIEEQIESCHANLGSDQFNGEIGLLFVLPALFIAALLLVQLYRSNLEDYSYVFILETTLVSQKIQLND